MLVAFFVRCRPFQNGGTYGRTWETELLQSGDRSSDFRRPLQPTYKRYGGVRIVVFLRVHSSVRRRRALETFCRDAGGSGGPAIRDNGLSATF